MSPRAPAAAVALACILSLPSLRLGLALDDFWHRAKLTGSSRWNPSATGPLSLFSFVEGTKEQYDQIIESGFTPWWITPNLRIQFLRPLSSLTHALDYALWPASPWIMHAQSIAWYAVVVALAAQAYRRLLAPVSPLAAGIATLFYAIDPAHALPVGWLANRNALVAAAFALATLLLHHARRPVLAAGTLALALGGGESGIAIVGYLAAHALFLDDRTTRAKAIAFAPLGAVLVAWALIYRVGRYGVIGSGVYADPIQEPLTYVESVAAHVPLLLGVELGAPKPDPFPFLPITARAVLLLLGTLFTLWAALLLRQLVRRDGPERGVVLFFAVGSVLAVLPGSATFPAGRLLLIGSFGLLALVAVVCAKAGAEMKDRSARAFAAWAWLTHGLLAPLAFVFGLHDMFFVGSVLREYGKEIPVDGSAGDKRLVILNAPDTAFAYYVIIHPIEDGQRPPEKMLTMTGNARDVSIRRTAERSFLVHEDGGFYRGGTEILFRDPSVPLPVGTRIAQSDTSLTITHVLDDGIPDEVRIDFARPLDEGYLFYAWRGRSLVPTELPAIGESVSFSGRYPQLPKP